MKRLLVIILFLCSALIYADTWKFVDDTNQIQTTIGYSDSGVQYICDWIQSTEYNGITLHVKSNKMFYLGRFTTSCIIVDDYVFPSEGRNGFNDNSVYLRFNQKTLSNIVNDGNEHEVIIKIAGYLFTTKINVIHGEFKD